MFPRLVALEHRVGYERDAQASGIEALDRLLGGGIDRGTSTLLLGPSGTGKSLFALQFAIAAIERGEKAAMFSFDEELGLLEMRLLKIGIDIAAMRESGALLLEQIDAAEMSPGEFAQRVRDCVTRSGARTVVIDSMNGYQAAMPQENALVLHIHELLQFLNRQGATTYLTVAQHGLVGDMQSPLDVTYIADTVILLRYFEALGRVRRAVSVIKKRTGPHEDTIREFKITQRGLELGAPLYGFHGVLRGVPDFVGASDPLMEANANDVVR